MIHIPTINVKEHSYEQVWTTYPCGKTNRFISVYGHTNLASICFDTSIRSSIVQKILLNGICINGDQYCFLGCSSSGIKERKCYLWKGLAKDVEEKLKSLGEFHKEKSVSKRLSRIGLLFSEIQLTDVEVSDTNLCKIPDIESGEHNFTDGCGLINKTLAQQLYLKINGQYPEEYLPSVFQVRLLGYKGILALDSDLSKSSRISVRQSMEKFGTTKLSAKKLTTIGICNHSKPNTFGHLNKQFIMLLSGLGIRDEVFIDKQEQYLEKLTTMTWNSESAIMMLQWQNEFELAQKIVRAGDIESISGDEKELVKSSLKKYQQNLVKKLYKQQKEKQNHEKKFERLRILIPDSRNLFGVCDPSSTLEYGECFVRVTLSGKPTNIGGQVVVCKNPCYLLGDVRVLSAKSNADKPELSQLNHLVDCIVFPTKGKRPHSDEIAGSDLDGDQYFVCWDSELIPKEIRPPYGYPSAKSKPEGTITLQNTIAYFSRQNGTQKTMGKISKYFDQWADEKGVACSECERLGQLFSKAVDAAKSGEAVEIPDGLIPRTLDLDSQQSKSQSNYIWQKMIEKAKKYDEQFKTELLEQITTDKSEEEISEEFVFEIVGKEYSSISEFNKFRFAWLYLKQSTGLDDPECVEYFIDTYADYINFGKFTIDEKRETIDLGFPRTLVLNALNKSKILSEEDLEHFKMEGPENKWNKLIARQQESFDWRQLVKTLSTNDSVLLIFEMPDGVIIQLQFHEKQKIGQENPLNPGTVSGIFISKHFGFRSKYVLGPSFYIDLTEDTLQLYRDKQMNLTFLWLKATDRKKKKNGRYDKAASDEVVNSVSMDIQKYPSVNSKGRHPLVNKIPFIQIEMYALKHDGDEPYWDIYDANAMTEVQEVVEDECEDDAVDVKDCDVLFPVKEFEDKIRLENEMKEVYGSVIETGNPHLFQSLLKHSKHPEGLLEYFVSLLDTLVAKTTPFGISDIIKSVIEQMTLTIFELRPHLRPTMISKLCSLCSILCRIDMSDMAQLIVSKIEDIDSIDVTSLINTLGTWSSFLFFTTEVAMTLLCNLYRSVDARSNEEIREVETDGTPSADEQDIVDDGAAVSEDEVRVKRYIRHFGFLQGCLLVQDIKVCHELLTEASQDVEGRNSIINLKLDNSAKEDPTQITFYRIQASSESAEFSIGQYVAVSRQKLMKENPSFRSICAVGVIQKLQSAPFSITIKIDKPVPDILSSTNSEGIRYWRLDLVGNVISHKRVVAAFQRILNDVEHQKSGILQLIGCPNTHCTTEGIDDEHFSNVVTTSTNNLNEEQRRAVIASLRPKICLIQGPPGTGKTNVACHIVKHVVTESLYKGILVVAETNVAVDNLARCLQKDVIVLRLGSSFADDLFDITLEGQMKKIAEKEAKKTEFRDEAGNMHRNTTLLRRVLASADVILTTCVGSGEMILKDHTFEFVLVDEATKAMETTLLCSIAHGAKHLVMIGDHKQLGPIIRQDQTDDVVKGIPNISELADSLFHRLHHGNVIPTCFLNTQYRMHPKIMNFPSSEFYDNKLKAGELTTTRDPIQFDWPGGKDTPLCFINAEGIESKQGTSYLNKGEIDIVDQVIQRLLKPDYIAERKDDRNTSVRDIGVLTLYRAQELALTKRLPNSITVKSVDGFQGQERDIIVVSTVRCNDRQDVGFSGDANRVNVLLTRAKRGLIVVGNRKTLQASPIWKRWLSQVHTLKWPLSGTKPVIGRPSTKPHQHQAATGSKTATDRSSNIHWHGQHQNGQQQRTNSSFMAKTRGKHK